MSNEKVIESQPWRPIVSRKRLTYDEVLALIVLARSAKISITIIADAVDLGFGRGIIEDGPGIDYNAVWLLDGRRLESRIAGRQMTVNLSHKPDPYYARVKAGSFYLPFRID